MYCVRFLADFWLNIAILLLAGEPILASIWSRLLLNKNSGTIVQLLLVGCSGVDSSHSQQPQQSTPAAVSQKRKTWAGKKILVCDRPILTLFN